MGATVLLGTRINPSDRGGVQNVFHRLARHLSQRGHSVAKAWLLPGAQPPEGELAWPLPPLVMRGHLPAPRSGLEASGALLRLGRRLRSIRPSVVNIHYVTAEAMYFLLLRRFFGYKVVLSVHGSDVLRPETDDARLLPRLLSGADAITTVSRATAIRVQALATLDPERLHIIPNGVDCEFWSAPAPSLDARAPIVLSVGRLDAVKGHDVLIRAFPRVRQRVPGARLIIAGDGGRRAELVRLAHDLGAGDDVDLRGWVDADGVRALMAQARTFVLPSRSEGLPVALLEAMASGVPSIATAVGGSAEVATAGSALLVPPDDPEALGTAVSDILLDADRASRLGRNARRRAAAFSAAASDAAYEGLLRQLAGNGHRQPS